MGLWNPFFAIPAAPAAGGPSASDKGLEQLLAAQQQTNALLEDLLRVLGMTPPPPAVPEDLLDGLGAAAGGISDTATVLQAVLQQQAKVIDALAREHAAIQQAARSPALVDSGGLRSPNLYYNAVEARYYRCRELVVQNLYVLAPKNIETTVGEIALPFQAPVLFTKYGVVGCTECAGLVQVAATVNNVPLTGTFIGQPADPLLVTKNLVTYNLLKMGVPVYLEGDLVFGPTVVQNTDADNDHSFIIILEFVRLDEVDPADVPNFRKV